MLLSLLDLFEKYVSFGGFRNKFSAFLVVYRGNTQTALTIIAPNVRHIRVSFHLLLFLLIM